MLVCSFGGVGTKKTSSLDSIDFVSVKKPHMEVFSWTGSL